MSKPELPQVAQWMMMEDDEVFNHFYDLPSAFSDGEGLKRFVYVPGTRPDRALLVAHADTVWPNQRNVIDLGYADGIIYSQNRAKMMEVVTRRGHKIMSSGFGIGADDRAGCAILWQLRKLGHSLLIVGGEEQGCIATSRLMNTPWWKNEINNTHQFAVEFDRHGQKDCVFYHVATKDFVEYVKKETGYIPAQGSVTDISHLCVDICGVNLSVGYYDEHRPDEKLIVDQWQNTLSIANTWLSKPNLPKYQLDRSKMFSMYESNWHNNHMSQDSYDEWYAKHLERNKIKRGTQKKTETQTSLIKVSISVDKETGKQLLTCPYDGCLTKMTDEQWFANRWKCIECEQEF